MRPARPLLAPVVTAVLAAALAGVAAAGCAPAVPSPTATPGATPGGATPGGGPDRPAVAPPWPARSAAEAAGLQRAADSGAQPWLLDPEDTALSYAAAAFGWDTAAAERTAPDAVVVTGPGGTRRTLLLVQPARTGPGGVWSVTAQL